MTVVGDARIMDKAARIASLFDLYGTLLTGRQREMIEVYYFEDWSLAEMSEQFSISRQAIHDSLHRAEDQLEAYEAALRLLETHRDEQALVRSILDAWQDARDHVPEALRNRLQALLQSLDAANQL